MVYKLDSFADPQVTQISFFANRIYGNFTKSSQPTLEGNAGTDSIGDSIADGALVTDVLDTQRKTRLVVDDDGEATIFRLDLDLDDFIKVDFAFVDNHNLRTSYAEAVRNNIALWHDTDGTYNGSTEITPSKHFSGLVGAGRPYLEFDGVDDIMTVADDADLDFGNGNGSFEMIVRIQGSLTVSSFFATRYTDADNKFELMFDGANSRLEARFRVGATNLHIAESAWIPTANPWYHLVWTFENGVSNALYINGVSQTLVVDTKTGGDMSLAVALDFAERDTIFRQIDMALCRQWNRELSAAEVLTLYGYWTHTPIPAADQWGDQAADNVSACENGTQPYDTFDGESATGFHVIKTTTEAGAARVATADEIVFVDGKHYQVVFNASLTSGFAPQCDLMASKAASGSKSDEGAQTVEAGLNVITFTASESHTGVLQFFNSTSQVSEFTIANLLVSAGGCVAEYHPDGINPHEGIWYDTSPNNLDGTITGATEKDCPTAVNGEGDLTLYVFTEVEKQYLFWRFNAAGLTADDDSEIGQIGAGLIFTPSTRPDFNMIKRDEYGISGTETSGGRRFTNRRYGKRRRWQLSWSYVNQADRDNFQIFFDTIETANPWSNYPFIFTLNYDANEPVFHIGRIIGIPEVRDLTYQAYAISLILETEI